MCLCVCVCMCVNMCELTCVNMCDKVCVSCLVGDVLPQPALHALHPAGRNVGVLLHVLEGPGVLPEDVGRPKEKNERKLRENETRMRGE